MAPMTFPSESFIGTPPGKVIRPPLECSMLYSDPPGCEGGAQGTAPPERYRRGRFVRAEKADYCSVPFGALGRSSAIVPTGARMLSLYPRANFAVTIAQTSSARTGYAMNRA